MERGRELWRMCGIRQRADRRHDHRTSNPRKNPSGRPSPLTKRVAPA
ncbi:hypothetical protein EV137_5198 [Kribbella pratensis]|uniref:Uncharacterized protein n=1 Tax=Kribbella pratensis TaxID=2512112 RepID=A0ABY2F965_9ACTN|nr:hypothetical protein [Kribbella pratensis]TDW87126.1 hypothetical protein EV137_5198 [Kribbella pratensis]